MVSCQSNYLNRFEYETNHHPCIKPDEKYSSNFCSPSANSYHLQPEIPRNTNTFNYRETPGNPTRHPEALAPILRNNYEPQHNLHINFPSQIRPPLNTARPSYQMPQFNTINGSRRPQPLPNAYPPQLPNTNPPQPLPNAYPPQPLPNAYPPQPLPNAYPSQLLPNTNPSQLPNAYPPQPLPNAYPPQLPNTNPPQPLPNAYPSQLLPNTNPSQLPNKYPPQPLHNTYPHQPIPNAYPPQLPNTNPLQPIPNTYVPQPNIPYPNFQPLQNICKDLNAMSLNSHSRITQYPQPGPPAPQRAFHPKPIQSAPPSQSSYSYPSINHFNSHLNNELPSISMDDIKGEAITILMPSPPSREPGLEDIPMWAEHPVNQLPKDILDFICQRLDSIHYCERNWQELSNRRGFSLAILKRIREARLHTALLLECWNPNLRKFIDELNQIDCKKLISEIIRDLKDRSLPPIHSVHRSSPAAYSPYSPNTIVQRARAEYQPWPPSNPSLRPATPPTPPSPLSSSSSLSSSYTCNTSSSSPPSSYSSLSEEVESDPEIFVSYDKKDEEFGREVVRQVRELNYAVASEDDILAGGNELLERSKLFKNCRVIIGLISPDYFGDDFPYYEAIAGVNKSVTGMKRTFIPFHVRKTENIPEFITCRRGLQWTDEKKWDRLKRSLRV